ncbi:MAG TPA: hypothetical protein VIF57_30345 [Polyangia bacterium]|jgi:hypothetical protein
MLASACDGTVGDDDTTEKFSAVESTVLPNYVNARAMFLADSAGNTVYGSNWVKCASNQVLVGYYRASSGLCATLPAGTTLVSTHMDYPGSGSNHTTIFKNTGYDMHGCPDGSFMQGITVNGGSEWLYCATFNFGYSLGPILDQGCCGGPTTSAATWGLSTPNMHSCQAWFDPNYGEWFDAAMIGIHQGRNDFGCEF